MNSAAALRVAFLVCYAALQVTLLHLAASMLLVALGGGPSISWPALLATALLAALAVRRWESEDAQAGLVRWPTLLACALSVLYATKIHLGGGWNPLSGWQRLWPASPESPDAIVLLVGLVASLWAWWRGMALPDSDHADALRTLQNGVLFLVILAIVITPLSVVNLGGPPWGALFAMQGVAAVAFGLAALSLGRVESLDNAAPASRRRLVRSGLLATAGLVGLGVLGLSLVSSAATAALRQVIVVLATGMAVVLSPLAEAFYRFLLLLRGNGQAAPEPSPAASLVPQASQPALAPDGIDVRIFELLLTLFSALLYVLPLLALVVAILLMQRRRRKATDASGAEHESLWSWRSFAGDLRGALAGLVARRGAGLREALARLRGDDPARRIRRRYVEALLLGEAAKRERAPSQTPLEFEPLLRSVTPEAGAEVAELTDSYDRARYAPQTIQPADADQADAAWDAIRRSTKDAS